MLIKFKLFSSPGPTFRTEEIRTLLRLKCIAELLFLIAFDCKDVYSDQQVYMYYSL